VSARIALLTFVTPAKAGIHHLPMKFIPMVMGPRLRGNDEFGYVASC
jgi:hypothetical protein